MFAQVVFNLPLDRSYTYSIPHDLAEYVVPGVRVSVYLRKHLSTGFVIELSETAPEGEIKPVCDVLDAEPLVDEYLLRLTRWIAEYYLCSWGQALDCALPPGVRLSSRTRISLNRLPPSELSRIVSTLEQQAPVQFKILKILLEKRKMSLAQLQKAMGNDSLYGALSSLEKSGIVTRLTEVVRSEHVKRLTALRIPAHVDAVKAASTLASGSIKQGRLLELIADRGEILAAEAARSAGASYDTIQRLVKKGLVELFEKEIVRSYPTLSPSANDTAVHTLTAEQQEAVALIQRHLEQQQFQTVLLEGITGSGKTEVYLRAIDFVARKGMGAIVLVPEIALTPQTVSRFRGRFGDSVAVLHSRLSLGERYDEWRRIKAGILNIVVGARSAIFAPVKNLGLIVVDEEHEASYKQNETPRYQARDVAIMRARDANAVVVLGTATPSLETYHNVELGKYARTELSARVQSQVLPEIQLIDLRAAQRGQTVERILSDELAFKIGEKLARKEQAIIFLNRRGYTPFFLCPKCGVSLGCQHCSVALTYHATENKMKCHYCNSTSPVPQQCPYCGNAKLAKFGTGTERVQEEIENLFPDARIQRMDADTTSTKWAHEKIFTAFREGELDILVGTQMLAKGLDFPRVTLVGVVLADVALNLPDFRAAERTFQLLMQVGGRSGRSHRGGEVIIQTYNPAHYAIQCAKMHDYRGFYQEEMKLRREVGFPPYRRLMNVLVDSTSQKEALQATRRLAEVAKQGEAADARTLTIMGPSAAPLAKIKGRYRFRFLLLSPHAAVLKRIGQAIIDSHKKIHGAKARLTVDMDPVSMM
ncbi:MAG: primosomal protein N' [Candidatus Abyssobacteria bacterium SURF_5]|uniref:Replication restart protein PriA n=1 Tax=Abyssobacteria bacterium (strain SURF_5) TaxID=2093360 RepID=A0A3A4NHT9_ABYX5|nr:MAG: primosomal protein N' [Candidatus Abyssubacteria bacterium SURF_5]